MRSVARVDSLRGSEGREIGGSEMGSGRGREEGAGERWMLRAPPGAAVVVGEVMDGCAGGRWEGGEVTNVEEGGGPEVAPVPGRREAWEAERVGLLKRVDKGSRGFDGDKFEGVDWDMITFLNGGRAFVTGCCDLRDSLRGSFELWK